MNNVFKKIIVLALFSCFLIGIAFTDNRNVIENVIDNNASKNTGNDNTANQKIKNEDVSNTSAKTEPNIVRQMMQQHNLESFKVDFTTRHQPSYVAGVRGDAVTTSKTFEPYWKGQMVKIENEINILSDTEIINELEQLNTLMKNEKYNESINYIEKKLGEEYLPTEIEEYLYLQLVLVQTEIGNIEKALKSSQEYLLKYPVGNYRDNISEIINFLNELTD